MADLSSQKILLTGITGFIGSHTAIQLLQQGYQVRGSMRNLERAEEIKAVLAKQAPVKHLEFVQAELTNPTDWLEATKGVDYVQHIASPLPRVIPKDENELIIPAKEGALNVLKAAEQNGVKRVVLTSSAAAIGYGHQNNNRIFTESDWTNIEDKKDTTPYIRSKAIAEKSAWDYVKSEGVSVELTVVNPVAVMGPVLEEDFGTSALFVKKLMDGDMPGSPKLGFAIVDVRDVADMHIRAMLSTNAAGKRFICSNEGFVWVADVAQLLGKEFPNFKSKMPKVNLPNGIVRLFSLFDQETRSIINELGVERKFDNTLAQEVLGWHPRSNNEALKATAQSLIELDLV